MNLHRWSLTLQHNLMFGKFLSSLCQQATHECPSADSPEPYMSCVYQMNIGVCLDSIKPHVPGHPTAEQIFLTLLEL